ncbi:MAG: hypothetical protein SF052_21860 [Bacteroidia bacterium]|nr:hypothetical protein [Bacteroidia bacterium]
MYLAPVFRKIPGYPVYYRIDYEKNMIESVKDWPDKPKIIDRYPLTEPFAQNIAEIYEPIAARHYLIVRSYVILHLCDPKYPNHAAKLCPPPPTQGLH